MNLKLPVGGPTGVANRAMSVGELMKELKKFDPSMAVTYGNGWVVKVASTKGRSEVCKFFPNCPKKCDCGKPEKQVLLELCC